MLAIHGGGVRPEEEDLARRGGSALAGPGLAVEHCGGRGKPGLSSGPIIRFVAVAVVSMMLLVVVLVVIVSMSGSVVVVGIFVVGRDTVVLLALAVAPVASLLLLLWATLHHGSTIPVLACSLEQGNPIQSMDPPIPVICTLRYRLLLVDLFTLGFLGPVTMLSSWLFHSTFDTAQLPLQNVVKTLNTATKKAAKRNSARALNVMMYFPMSLHL